VKAIGAVGFDSGAVVPSSLADSGRFRKRMIRAVYGSPFCPMQRLIPAWSRSAAWIAAAGTPALRSAATSSPDSVAPAMRPPVWKKSMGGMPLPGATWWRGEASRQAASVAPNAASYISRILGPAPSSFTYRGTS